MYMFIAAFTCNVQYCMTASSLDLCIYHIVLLSMTIFATHKVPFLRTHDNKKHGRFLCSLYTLKLYSYFTAMHSSYQYIDYFLLQINTTHCTSSSFRYSATTQSSVQKWKFEHCNLLQCRCSEV